MPHYKLTYLPIRGKAECIRMVFAVAGVEFENARVDPAEWFAKLKQSGLSPSGQLPILEVDGEILTQSKAILSYVAKEHGVAPEGNFQQAQADMLGGIISDLEDMLSTIVREQDQEKKEKDLATANEEVIKKCGYFEKFLLANGKQGFFIGDKLTYGDIVVFAFLNSYFMKGSLPCGTDVIVSTNNAVHINGKHLLKSGYEGKASHFKPTFNLTATLARLTKRTWQDTEQYEILEFGVKDSHGFYFIYIFDMCKVIGWDQEGFPTRLVEFEPLFSLGIFCYDDMKKAITNTNTLYYICPRYLIQSFLRKTKANRVRWEMFLKPFYANHNNT